MPSPSFPFLHFFPSLLLSHFLLSSYLLPAFLPSSSLASGMSGSCSACAAPRARGGIPRVSRPREGCGRRARRPGGRLGLSGHPTAPVRFLLEPVTPWVPPGGGAEVRTPPPTAWVAEAQRRTVVTGSQDLADCVRFPAGISEGGFPSRCWSQRLY